jgi:hypothetical protein
MLGRPELPGWAEPVWVLWRDTLNALDSGAAEIGATLDWAIKRRLFARHLARRGIAWSTLRRWAIVLPRLLTSSSPHRLPARVWRILDPSPAMKARMAMFTPVLERHGLRWDELPTLVSARTEMFELDAKFAALGDRGLFNALEAAGALRHRVPGCDIGNAMDSPPQDTRARIRGDVVQRLSEAGVSYGADWTGVYDAEHGRELDLSDPFETEERWRERAVSTGGLRRRPVGCATVW